MKPAALLLPLFLLASPAIGAESTPHADGRTPATSPTRGALFGVTDPAGWSAGFHLEFENRGFGDGDEGIDLDQRRLTGRLGFGPGPAIRPWIEAGLGETEGNLGDADAGFAWGIGADIRVFDLSLEGNRTLPRKLVLGLETEFAFRALESDVPGGDVSWEELTVQPRLSLRRDHRGDAHRVSYLATGTEAYLGVRFSNAELDAPGSSLGERENLGLAVGARLRWREGFTTSVGGVFYGSEDRRLELGLAWHY